MDRAYSLEMADIIDAYEAYELYGVGIIADKRGFKCPDDNCNAQITCANIEKRIQDMKKGVYFRVNQNHDEKCRFENNENGESRIKVNTEGKTNAYKDELVDNFILKRPDNYYEKKAQVDTSNLNAIKEHKKRLNNEIDFSKRPNNHYYISPLVRHYLNNSDRNKMYVSINGKKIPYSEFFVDIAVTSFENISEYPRIYYQLAYINKIQKSESIQIRFQKGFLGNLKTSFFINQNTIKGYKTTYWEKKINEVVDSSRAESIVYIYGKPIKNKEYINFRCKNLDFFEMLSAKIK